jgi:hypothetical protein
MNRQTWQLLTDYMHACMQDSAHDREHVLRVLHNALDIAAHEENVNLDVLIAACHVASETILTDLKTVQGLGLAVTDMPVLGVDVIGLSSGIYQIVSRVTVSVNPVVCMLIAGCHERFVVTVP